MRRANLTPSISFQQKSCCLPHGGPVNPPSPPKGVACPTSGWSWHNGKQCCVPHQPPKPSNPPPQCPKECSDWSPNDLKCYPGKPTPPTPPPSKPSGSYNQPGHPGGNNNHWRRSKLHSRSAPLCPSGLEACPIQGALGGEFECLDTNEELESCGGCASTGAGQDCTAIEGAWNVACNQGRCAGASLRIST